MSDIQNDVISLPDIPMPAESNEPAGIQDTFTGALRYCFIGTGQAGGRIAEAFYNLGYRRVCAINSTHADLGTLSIPNDNKLAIESRGAGKSLELGKKYIDNAKEDVLDLIRRTCGTEYDHIMLCASAGGGSGAGSLETLIDIANEWASTCKILKADGQPKVGVILALPQQSEGQKPNKNAYVVLKRLLKLAGVYGDKPVIAPLVIVDNEKIAKIYPSVSIANFWDVANKSVCSLFHLFNLLASQESSFVAFDKQDYADIISCAGGLTLGATVLPSTPKDPTEISAALRNNLAKNILSSFDLKTGKKAGCIFVGHQSILETVPQEYLEHGFEMMTRLLAGDSTVHRGIYKGDKQNLSVFTIVAGLSASDARIAELRACAGLKDHDDLA